MKSTVFTFYRNTPFTNFQNTILFDSDTKRDSYFNSSFSQFDFGDRKFNFIRDRSTIRINKSYGECMGVNYCRFKSDFEVGQYYYAYVMEIKYINDITTELVLLIDGIMTFCQGTTLNTLNNLSVARKHLTRSAYNTKLPELRNNDDVLKTYTKGYIQNDYFKFGAFSVLIQISCSLTTDFGKVDDPKIVTSEGLTFDKITAPVNLYVVPKTKFKELMEKLGKFPWITQNIRSVSLIPTVFFTGATHKVSPKSFSFSELYIIMDNGFSSMKEFDGYMNKLSKNQNNMCKMFGLDTKEDLHLLRNEYTTTEMNTFTGEQLFVDNGLLSEKGLSLKSKAVIGLHNEIAVYIENYKANYDIEGSFLNDAIFIRNFDDVPIMIDNYNLALSKSANQRQLAESKLVTNQIKNITDGNGDLKQRFLDGASLISNITPATLFGKFKDEHDFYRQQQAEFKDLALESNTVTGMTNNNSLAIRNDFFGITVKYSCPTNSEWNKIKKYYKMFGYHVNEENSTIDPHTMTVCDYVQFSGNLIFRNVDVGIVEMMKAQFENGVRFWHHNGLVRPMEQDVLQNKIRK